MHGLRSTSGAGTSEGTRRVPSERWVELRAWLRDVARPEGRRAVPPGALGMSLLADGRQAMARPSTRPVAAAAVALAMAVAMVGALPLQQAHAASTNHLTLAVVSARTEPRAFGGAGVLKGDAVTEYQYLINVDNTGTTTQRSAAPGSGCYAGDPGYPGSCGWPSISEEPHASPIYAQGDQADFAAGGLSIPDGRYLISVLADGYKIDGAHFTMPLPTPGLVTVELQPNPLPDSTLRAQVFADTASTNGTIDQGEPGLAGFVGHINDTLGEVSTDVYGNPLCTTYVGEDPVTHEFPSGSLDAERLPVVKTIGRQLRQRRGRSADDPAPGHQPVHAVRHSRRTVRPGSRRPPSRATTTGTPGSWRARPATTPSSPSPASPSRRRSSASSRRRTTAAPDPAAAGHIKGVVDGIKQYTPPRGGNVNFWLGMTGSKIDKPIVQPVDLARRPAGR